MLESSQPWSLFGFDLRQVGHYFKAGWKEFLWDARSPVLAAVDEVVRVNQPSGDIAFYRAGEKVPDPGPGVATASTAIVLPDNLVLAKVLQVPAAAEAELESVVALEVTTSSPFTAEDTSFGWQILGRDDEFLSVAVVISSRSAVMEYVAEHFDSHDVHAFEIWADLAALDVAGADKQLVTLSGFGEGARRVRNAGKMRQLAVIITYCLLVLVLIFAVAAGAKYLELQRVQSIHSEVEVEASDALRIREQLTASKELIAEAQELTLSLRAPHAEFRRLTKVLGSDTWLSLAEIKGRKIKIEGESGNAAAVMQQLLDNPAYANVEAPAAFKKVRSGMERFVLNLTLATPGAPE